MGWPGPERAIHWVKFGNWKKRYGGLGVAEMRRLVDSLDLSYRLGVRRACAVLEFSRTSYYYRSIKVDDPALSVDAK
jgi:hypothetical protein